MGYSLSDFEYYSDELIHIFTVFGGYVGYDYEIYEYEFLVYDIELTPLVSYDPSDELVKQYKNSDERWEETIRDTMAGRHHLHAEILPRVICIIRTMNCQSIRIKTTPR